MKSLKLLSIILLFFGMLSCSSTPSVESLDLKLTDMHNNTYELKDVIAEHAGKVIYVDLWASWCEPCRSSMPSAKELRKEYADKDVVFLYIVVDDKIENWEKAVTECETEAHNGINYFAGDCSGTKFDSDIKGMFIPQYLLFDKEGTLVDKSAPGPKESNIRKEIDKLLQ